MTRIAPVSPLISLEAVQSLRRRTPRTITLSGRRRRGGWHLWHPRLLLGATLAGAMACAVAGAVVGVVLLRQEPSDALISYGLGVVAGAAAGFLLGLVLSALAALGERLRRGRSSPSQQLWMRYRRSL